MANFCTHCHKEMGFPGKADINVEKIFDELEKNTMVNVICEGCGMASIGNIKGEMKVRYFNIDSDTLVDKWLNYVPDKLSIR